MPAPSIDPGELANSRLADTAPALIAVAVILVVLLTFLAWVFARILANSTEATKRTADALEKNADTNAKVGAALVEMNSSSMTREAASHVWQAELSKVMTGISTRLDASGEKLTAIHGDVLHIKTSLGKD
jgi:regulatory protein YycI of two-component signal transduction system YycFG